MASMALNRAAALYCTLAVLVAGALPSDAADGDDNVNVTKLDCGFRVLAFAQAKRLQPFRDASAFPAAFDALELGTLCHETFDNLHRSVAPAPGPVHQPRPCRGGA